jgi:predicted CXXCH cytochrome family protein
MPRETGKQRHSRIELDYYQRADALARRRRRIVGLVLALVLLWLVVAPFWNRGRSAPRVFQWKQLASHGELAHAHAPWEARCEACHVPWAPVDGSRWSPLRPGVMATDRLCQGCHAVGPHSERQIEGEVVACAECHRDHQGRDASLVRIADDNCTRCHEDLAAHRVTPPTAVGGSSADRIRSFPDHHPEFRPTEDPGRLAFDHKRHLEPGRAVGADGQPFHFQLECRSCHQPDNDGALMKPVLYEAHCRSCHPLNFDPNDPSRTVRHGQQPSQVVAELTGIYSAGAAQPDSPLLRPAARPRPLPGRTAKEVGSSRDEAIDVRVAAAVRSLFVAAPPRDPKAAPADRRGCLLCHTFEKPLPPGRMTDPKAISEARLVPPSVPAVWYGKARFDHSAHRGVSCASCHEAVAASRTEADVLLPSKASCAQCHAPYGSGDEGPEVGGAGSGCTECHRYHPPDYDGGTPRLDARSFLQGSAKAP